jgi:hypothetical protein
MTELGNTAVALRPARLALPNPKIATPAGEMFGFVLFLPILMAVAVWNGFPIIFYDTGAYMLQGLGHVFVAERSPIYSAFLAITGGASSLWFVAIAQSLIVAFVMVEFARMVRPELRLLPFLGIGAVLCVATGLPWYATQIEPDCFVALVPMIFYLLAFHGERLGRTRRILLFFAAVTAIACHSSHIALAAGLLAVLAAMRFAPLDYVEVLGLKRPRVAVAALSLAMAMVAVYAANYAFTGKLFFSRSGAIFLEARIMEDGLIEPVLDADCPGAGYQLCRYKDRLPSRADTWLWMEHASPFKKVGGFEKREPESARLVRESLTRYPIENAVVALQDAILQFFWFQTGDGIVPQEWVLNREFQIAIPHQMSAYTRAYQQAGEIWFVPINIVHVPAAVLSLLALGWLLREAWRRRDAAAAFLPGFTMLALAGNAFICGVFSGPHGRYQSRIMWLAAFTVLLIAWPEIERWWRARRAAG